LVVIKPRTRARSQRNSNKTRAELVGDPSNSVKMREHPRNFLEKHGYQAKGDSITTAGMHESGRNADAG
jgi:hypothetical protein